MTLMKTKHIVFITGSKTWIKIPAKQYKNINTFCSQPIKVYPFLDWVFWNQLVKLHSPDWVLTGQFWVLCLTGTFNRVATVPEISDFLFYISSTWSRMSRALNLENIWIFSNSAPRDHLVFQKRIAYYFPSDFLFSLPQKI